MLQVSIDLQKKNMQIIPLILLEFMLPLKHILYQRKPETYIFHLTHKRTCAEIKK